MRKAFVVVMLLSIAIGAFAQQKADSKWSGTLRFKPAATIIGLVDGIPEIVVDWVPYVSPNLGIPIEFDAASYNGYFLGGVLAGVETELVGSSEKNGLYLATLGGIYIIGPYYCIAGKADIGYQLLTDGGFLFTPAAGFKFNTLTGFSFDLMLDIGFAYR